ncbi:hypothetical protein KIPB_010742, partial [Kipferlia bialata]|eukprot:g10742.t1
MAGDAAASSDVMKDWTQFVRGNEAYRTETASGLLGRLLRALATPGFDMP